MDCFDLCQSGQATLGGGHDFPLLQQQFKHVAPLLIPKLKWNDITVQVSFTFRTRQSGQATRGGGHDFPLLDQQFNHIAPLLISK